jgi:hypothetical protein
MKSERFWRARAAFTHTQAVGNIFSNLILASGENNRAPEEPKRCCSEAKIGCLGSCTISTQETHHLISQPPTAIPETDGGMEILSQEQNQVQEPIAEQYTEMERSQDNYYWSQMLKHLPEQVRGPVPNKK